ncbi:hypothetical protein EDC04DRAFT_2601495 [Pisolithus marmoratus]|nr:hypothetical protein EDC04DRAFT_2601495 [Pisolithus marmoratus]
MAVNGVCLSCLWVWLCMGSACLWLCMSTATLVHGCGSQWGLPVLSHGDTTPPNATWFPWPDKKMHNFKSSSGDFLSSMSITSPPLGYSKILTVLSSLSMVSHQSTIKVLLGHVYHVNHLPSIIAQGMQDFYVFEPMKLMDGTVIVPEHWYTKLSTPGSPSSDFEYWGHMCQFLLSFLHLLQTYQMDGQPDPCNIIEMLDGIVDQLKYAQMHGIWAWDIEAGEMALIIPAILVMLGDNPMQSKLACHVGLQEMSCISQNARAAALRQCKILWIEQDTFLEYTEAVSTITQGQLVKQFMSPVWRIKGLNPHQDTPVEILHVILLGFLKYFWCDAISRLNNAQKVELQASQFSELSTFICEEPGHWQSLHAYLAASNWLQAFEWTGRNHGTFSEHAECCGDGIKGIKGRFQLSVDQVVLIISKDLVMQVGWTNYKGLHYDVKEWLKSHADVLGFQNVFSNPAN